MKVFLFILFTLSGHAASLSPELGARLAALVNEGEGNRVSEELFRRGDHRGTAIQKKLQRLADEAIPFLDESVRNAPWNDVGMGIDGPICFDAAPKFGLLLRTLGLPGWVAAAGHHVFLLVETREATLIIDPTIRQYFGQSSAPDWVPTIFVGTLSELRRLYEREPGLPVLPYREIYFNEEWPATRRDSKMLSQRNALLRAPGDREHAPLVEFLERNIVR